MTEQDKARLKRARVLDRAAELIIRYGYDKTSVDDIAREAGISKGAFYLVFRSKDALFMALIRRESETLIQALIAGMDAEPGGMSLFTLYQHSIRQMMQQPLLRALYVSDRRVLGGWQERLRGQHGEGIGMSVGREFVQGMQAAGLIRADADPMLITAVMLIIRQGMLSLPDQMPGVLDPASPNAVALDALGDTLAAMMAHVFSTPHGDSEAGKAALRAMFARAMDMMNTADADPSQGDAQNADAQNAEPQDGDPPPPSQKE